MNLAGKTCTTCGREMTRALDHNCGFATISKDRLRTLEEYEREAIAIAKEDRS